MSDFVGPADFGDDSVDMNDYGDSTVLVLVSPPAGPLSDSFVSVDGPAGPGRVVTLTAPPRPAVASTVLREGTAPPVEGGCLLDLVRVEIGPGSSPLAPSPQWQTLGRIESMSVDRGRSGPLGPFGAGSCTVTADNASGVLDPYRADVPNVPVRIVATFEDFERTLFSGFVDKSSVSFDGPFESRVTFSATDATKFLARETDLGDLVLGTGLLAPRVAAILDRIGWPAALRDIAPGQVMHLPTVADGDAVSALNDLADVEGTTSGWFVTTDGRIRFDARYTFFDQTATATARFSNDVPDDSVGTMVDPVTSVSELDMFNRATVDHPTHPGEATDLASVYARGAVRSPDRPMFSVSQSAPKVEAKAIVTVYGEPAPAVESIKVEPVRSSAFFASLIRLELRDRITVELVPAHGPTVNADHYVESIGIAATSGDSGRWVETLGLSPARYDKLSPERWFRFGLGRPGLDNVAI